MSIFSSIFGNTPAPQAPAQQPQAFQQAPTPGNIPANVAVTSASTATPATAPNGLVPAATNVDGNNPAKSGLDQFADLFNTEATQSEAGQPLFNISRDKVMESARKQDFKAAATEEQMQAILKGGSEAAAAMMEIMNTMAQNVYGQATFATTQLIEGGLKKGNYARNEDVDQRIRSSSVSNSLREDNPLFSHPAAQPILASVQSSLLTKFPNATPKEIADMARQYVVEFANTAKAPEVAAQAKNKSKTPGDIDWSSFA